jgi:serine/threonine-protein kinase RsbW
VVADLTARVRELDADASVASGSGECDGERPDLVFIDLASSPRTVRKARATYGLETELIAIVDSDSVDSLLPAIAAGCSDYLFHPINGAELGLRWQRHVAGRGGDRPHRPAGLSGTLHLEFPSSVGYVRHAVAEVVEACERLAFAGSRATLNLRVALGEVLANAILYGNDEDAGRLVRIDADLKPGTAVVTVTDEGKGFDPAGVLDPTLPENRDRSHGRGLFLLRTLADEVAFSERGNAVTLTVRSPGG